MLVELCAAILAPAEEVPLSWKWHGQGAMERFLDWRPQRLTLARADSRLPVPDLAARFAWWDGPAGTVTLAVTDSRLWADLNRNEKWDRGEMLTWQQGEYVSEGTRRTMHRARYSVSVKALGSSRRGDLRIYRFDPSDRQRIDLTGTILAGADWYATATLGKGKAQIVLGLRSRLPSGLFGAEDVALYADQDGNGSFEADEQMDAITWQGKNWRLGRDLMSLVEGLPPTPPKLEPLAPGRQIAVLEARDQAGHRLRLPRDFPGQVILLQFIRASDEAEENDLVAVAALRRDLSARGLAVVTVVLGEPAGNEIGRVIEFGDGLPADWRQVFPVSDLPWRVLIDGDTGRCLLQGESLAGDRLPKAVREAVRQKSGYSASP